jgi:ribonuclease HI
MVGDGPLLEQTTSRFFRAMQRVTIFTDGACRKNPGHGGWAAVLRYQGRQRVLSGSARSTTNNRMELMAAIEGLNALKRRCAVELFTDSEYLRKGIRNWLPRWKRRGFRTIDGHQPVKNQDLWQRLEQAAGQHEVEWKWVRGHAAIDSTNSATGLPKKPSRMGIP